MESLHQTIALFQRWLDALSFPAAPANLYSAITYFLEGGGKRLRPVLCLLGNELFGELHADAYHAATAIELYHNSSLVHDDMLAHTVLRREREAVSRRYNTNTALLAGDVLLIHAFAHINRITHKRRTTISTVFSKAAFMVCEGQQLEMDQDGALLTTVRYADYLEMAGKKTAALLAASIKIGGMIGGATPVQQEELYQFGYNLGMAFQLQEDYLDAFGVPEQTGKQRGGDILASKKTALLIKAMEVSEGRRPGWLAQALREPGHEKVVAVMEIYRACGLDTWLQGEIAGYASLAFASLERIAVTAGRKEQLLALSDLLLVRQG